MKNNDQKRIFFGIPIDDKITSILPAINSAIHYKTSSIKWIPIEYIHLTLSFIGDIPNNDIPDLIQLVKKNISIAQFQLRISGAGVFPSSKSAKILWLGLDRGINEIKILNHQIKKSAKKFIDCNKQNTFIPHITIARIKKGCLKTDVLPFLNIVYSPIDLDINSISMYESKLSHEGAKYNVLKMFPLAN